MVWRLYIVACALLLVVSARPNSFGHGGHGMHSKVHLNWAGVINCLFELVDLNHDRQLSRIELDAIITKYITTVEQAIDGLSPHRLLAACDTDGNHLINWTEAVMEPHCLTMAQTEGLAKWLCSRARHADYSFAEYTAIAYTIEDGFIHGKGFKSIVSETRRVMRDQTAARRALLARIHHTGRLSDEVDQLVNDLAQPASVLAIAVAIPLFLLALCVALL